MSTVNLADRVLAQLEFDAQADDMMTRAYLNLERGDGGLDVRQMNAAYWGLLLGLAYGIARGEDPYESHESVMQRAYTAAIDAHHRHAHCAPNLDPECVAA